MRLRDQPLSLAEIVDLELRFAADHDLDRAALRERDESLGRRILGDRLALPRHELFRRWLAEQRDGTQPSTGERVETAFRLLAGALAFIALVAGVGAARTVLAYDGQDPVNVVHFLAVFVLGQLALVVLAVLAALPRSLLGRIAGYGPLFELLRTLVYGRLAALGRRDGLGDAIGRLKHLGAVYGRVERWILLAITQRAAFCFNVGALLTCAYLIAFTDLAFAWSTTLRLSSTAMTSMIHTIALPWSWLGAAVPSAELVEASRYFRQEAAHDPQVLRDWWTFLVAGLCTYGLLPRFVLWQLAASRARRLRAGLPLDHGECQVAYERILRGGHAAVAGGDVLTPRANEQLSVAAERLPPRDETIACSVVGWGDVPVDHDEATALIAERFGWGVDSVATVESPGGSRDRARVIDGLRSDDPVAPVIVLAEAWEAPTRSVLSFLSEMRAAVGKTRPVVIGLLGGIPGRWRAASDDDREVWRRRLQELGDPYLRVESVIEP